MEIRERMPAVALRGMTILPDMMIHFDLSREKSIQAVEQANQMQGKTMFLGHNRVIVLGQSLVAESIQPILFLEGECPTYIQDLLD